MVWLLRVKRVKRNGRRLNRVAGSNNLLRSPIHSIILAVRAGWIRVHCLYRRLFRDITSYHRTPTPSTPSSCCGNQPCR